MSNAKEKNLILLSYLN